MCNITNVLDSSYKAANVIVSTVYEYGGYDLGRGVRKLVVNSYNSGFINGQYVGIAKGVVGTVLAYATAKVVIKGTEFIKGKIDQYNIDQNGDINHEQMQTM